MAIQEFPPPPPPPLCQFGGPRCNCSGLRGDDFSLNDRIENDLRLPNRELHAPPNKPKPTYINKTANVDHPARHRTTLRWDASFSAPAYAWPTSNIWLPPVSRAHRDGHCGLRQRSEELHRWDRGLERPGEQAGLLQLHGRRPLGPAGWRRDHARRPRRADVLLS